MLCSQHVFRCPLIWENREIGENPIRAQRCVRDWLIDITDKSREGFNQDELESEDRPKNGNRSPLEKFFRIFFI